MRGNSPKIGKDFVRKERGNDRNLRGGTRNSTDKHRVAVMSSPELKTPGFILIRNSSDIEL